MRKQLIAVRCKSGFYETVKIFTVFSDPNYWIDPITQILTIIGEQYSGFQVISINPTDAFIV